MKNKRIQKLFTSLYSLLACALLIGNTIPVPPPTDEEGNSIIIELPSSEDEGEEPEYRPQGDDEPFGDDGE